MTNKIEKFLAKSAPMVDFVQTPDEMAAIMAAGQDGQILPVLASLTPHYGGEKYNGWRDILLSPRTRGIVRSAILAGRISQVGEPCDPR